MIKKTYKLKGLDCASCAVNLECDLECFCKSAKCDFIKSRLDVVYENKDTEKQIFETVKKANLQIE